MNGDINTMLLLQKRWIAVLDARNETERCLKNIDFWKNRISEAEGKVYRLKDNIKAKELEIKQEELELSGAEEKIRELEQKRNLLKSEKEINALDSELAQSKAKAALTEEKLIGLMDALADEESGLAVAQKELEEAGVNGEKSIDKLSADIIRLKEEETAGLRAYEELLPELSPGHRLRFDKLVKAKKGRAVGELKGGVCSLCNCNVSQLAAEASKGENAVVCTNCGCYVYKNDL